MSFEEYCAKIQERQAMLRSKGLKSNITTAQWKLLQCLFERGESLPREWIPREELHNLIGQSDYRRRITELIELGIDIELKSGSNMYRLRSLELNQSNPRTYLSAAQKKALLENNNYTCQICGKIDELNKNKSLQADHRIPLSRNGTHAMINWQTLCKDCNVGKKRACVDCIQECDKCVWAFPEKHGIRVILSLEPETINKILSFGVQNQDVSQWIYTLIKRELRK